MTIKKTGGAICAVSIIVGIVLCMDSGLRINREGLELIGGSENCMRVPYYCPAGVLTDGVGNTNGVIANKLKTDEEIARDWARNIAEAEKCVNQYANGQSMNVNQFSAITSFAFNVGCGALQKSTLARHALRQRWPEMCAQLKRWTFGGGKELPGLVERRGDEYKLCMKDVK